jgi:hypothetical protein
VLEALALIMVLGAPLGVWLANWRSEQVLRSALERLRTKGIDVGFEQPEQFLPRPGLGAQPAAGTAPVAARSAVGALYALEWRFPDLADLGSPLWRALQRLEPARLGERRELSSEERQQVQDLVMANEPLLLVLDEMASLPRGDSRSIFKKAAASGRDPFAWPLPDELALRGAALLLAHRARLEDLEGRSDAALHTLSGILKLSNQYADLPWLVSALRRRILADVALNGFERMQARWTIRNEPDQFESALSRVEPLAELPRAVEGELKSILWTFDLLRRRSPSEIAEGFSGARFSIGTLGWSVYGSRPLRFWINGDEALYLEFMADYVEATRRPIYEARADLLRIDAAVAPLDNWLHPVMSMALVSVTGMAEGAAHLESRAVRARLRLALERYRARHRAFPETLDELRPAEVAEVPRDPVSGLPYVYRLTATDYALESGS